MESYASATGLRLTAIEFLEKIKNQVYSEKFLQTCWIQKQCTMPPLKEMNWHKEIFNYTGKILGIALANAVMTTSPEAIILFGGLTKAGDFILKPTRDSMEENLIQVFQNKVKILISHLKEAHAATFLVQVLWYGKKNSRMEQTELKRTEFSPIKNPFFA